MPVIETYDLTKVFQITREAVFLLIAYHVGLYGLRHYSGTGS